MLSRRNLIKGSKIGVASQANGAQSKCPIPYNRIHGVYSGFSMNIRNCFCSLIFLSAIASSFGSLRF